MSGEWQILTPSDRDQIHEHRLHCPFCDHTYTDELDYFTHRCPPLPEPPTYEQAAQSFFDNRRKIEREPLPTFEMEFSKLSWVIVVSLIIWMFIALALIYIS